MFFKKVDLQFTFTRRTSRAESKALLSLIAQSVLVRHVAPIEQLLLEHFPASRTVHKAIHLQQSSVAQRAFVSALSLLSCFVVTVVWELLQWNRLIRSYDSLLPVRKCAVCCRQRDFGALYEPHRYRWQQSNDVVTRKRRDCDVHSYCLLQTYASVLNDNLYCSIIGAAKFFLSTPPFPLFEGHLNLSGRVK